MRNLTIRTLIVGGAGLALASLYTFLSPRVEAAKGLLSANDKWRQACER
jgi:hypothetical protein